MKTKTESSATFIFFIQICTCFPRALSRCRLSKAHQWCALFLLPRNGFPCRRADALGCALSCICDGRSRQMASAKAERTPALYGTLDESALLAVGTCVATREGWPAQGHPCVFWVASLNGKESRPLVNGSSFVPVPFGASCSTQPIIRIAKFKFMTAVLLVTKALVPTFNSPDRPVLRPDVYMQLHGIYFFVLRQDVSRDADERGGGESNDRRSPKRRKLFAK